MLILQTTITPPQKNAHLKFGRHLQDRHGTVNHWSEPNERHSWYLLGIFFNIEDFTTLSVLSLGPA